MSASKALFEHGLAIGRSYGDINKIAFSPEPEPQIISPEVAAVADLLAARDEASAALGGTSDAHKMLARMHSDSVVRNAAERASDAADVDRLVMQVTELSKIVEEASAAEQLARQEKHEASDALAARIDAKNALFRSIADSVMMCDAEDVPSLSDVEAINSSLNKLGEEILHVTNEDEEGHSELKASFVTIQKAQRLFEEKRDIHARCSEQLTRARQDLQLVVQKIADKRQELERKSKFARKESRQLQRQVGRHALVEQAPSTKRSIRFLGKFSIHKSSQLALEAK